MRIRTRPSSSSFKACELPTTSDKRSQRPGFDRRGCLRSARSSSRSCDGTLARWKDQPEKKGQWIPLGLVARVPARCILPQRDVENDEIGESQDLPPAGRELCVDSFFSTSMTLANLDVAAVRLGNGRADNRESEEIV